MDLEWKAFGADRITCPKCGAEDYELADYPKALQRDGDTARVECYQCGAALEVILGVSYSYTTVSALDIAARGQ